MMDFYTNYFYIGASRIFVLPMGWRMDAKKRL